MKENKDKLNTAAVLRFLEAALDEFEKKGKVMSVRCDVCGSLIEISWVNERKTAMSHRCSCGKFHGTLKGLFRTPQTVKKS